jgi:hypothetical protein
LEDAARLTVKDLQLPNCGKGSVQAIRRGLARKGLSLMADGPLHKRLERLERDRDVIESEISRLRTEIALAGVDRGNPIVLESVPLSPAASNVLWLLGCATLQDARRLSVHDLKGRHVASRTIDEIRVALKRVGLRLGMRVGRADREASRG